MRKIDKIIFVVLFCVGLGFFTRGAIGSYSAIGSYGWEEVSGTVVYNNIRRFRPDGARHGTYFYQAEIRYTYDANGIKRRGDIIYPTYTSNRTREAAQEWLDKYPVNQQVSVYMNPDDSRESMLVTGIKIDHFLDILIGFAMSALALYMLRRKHKR